MTIISLLFAFIFLFLFAREPAKASGRKTAIFAGGCFWCMEPPFKQVEGVLEVTAGYTGGHVDDPDYEQVTAGNTGHYEAVRVVYDPSRVGYETLLDVFWRQIDPTDDGGQFADRGTQYATAIFYTDDEQRKSAEKSKARLNEAAVFTKPVVTAVLPATAFYQAEEYHQNYAGKNATHYLRYKIGSGRAEFLENTWKGREAENVTGTIYSKPSEEELRRKLTALQYKVTQEEGTEPPFDNDYWNNKQPGIYVDIISGEPLFSSLDKYDSGTGWPSFSKPLVGENIVEKKDNRLLSVRTEIRSRAGDSHLGHVFADGPEPTGLRYCLNSAALRFIPADKLAEEGYGRFREFFEN